MTSPFLDLAQYAAILANRCQHIREICANGMARWDRNTSGYWLAESIINILNGTIDDQIITAAADPRLTP